MRHKLLIFLACLSLFSCVDDPVSPLPRMRQRAWSFEDTPDKWVLLGDYEYAEAGLLDEKGDIIKWYNAYHTWTFVVDQNGEPLNNGTYKQTDIAIYQNDTIWDSFTVTDVKDSYFVTTKGIYNLVWNPFK